FRRVCEVVNHGRDLEAQPGDAGVCDSAAFVEGLLAGYRDFVLGVVLILPGVDGVRFLNVHYVKGGAVPILVVELVERGDLPAKRRSGVASKDEHYGFAAPKGREPDARLLVLSGQVEVGRRVALPEPSGA